MSEFMSGSKANTSAVWAVSDGRAGNVTQAQALSSALIANNRWHKIEELFEHAGKFEPVVLSARLPWSLLPAKNWPAPKMALPRIQRERLIPPWPGIWIAAGRRTAPFTAAVRRWAKGKVYCVQILNPKTDLTDFDSVIVPSHDQIDGENVITTFGAPTYYSKQAKEKARRDFSNPYSKKDRSAVVLLGGKSKSYAFPNQIGRNLIENFKTLIEDGWKLRILTSRRTPQSISSMMRRFATEFDCQFWSNEKDDGPNPYLAWSLFSKVALVTEDSVNMVSEQANLGLPIYIVHTSGESAKMNRFRDNMISRSIARHFEGKLEIWSYEPIREAERVADILANKIIERFE